MVDSTVRAALNKLKLAFRDWLVDGSPSSGANDVVKPEVRAAIDDLTTSNEALESLLVGNANTFTTKALMDAAAANYLVGALARVTSDPTTSNNGFYIRSTPQSGGTFDAYSASVFASLVTAALNAEIAAEAAQAAAELAEAGAIGVTGFDVGIPDRTQVVNFEGTGVVDMPSDVWGALSKDTGRGAVTIPGGAGIIINDEAAVDGGVGLNTGAFASVDNPAVFHLNTWLWIRQPEGPSPGLRAWLSMERRRAPEETGETIAINTSTGLVTTAAHASKYTFFQVGLGHSDFQPSPDGSPLTVSPGFDIGNALMGLSNGTVTPAIGQATVLSLTDMYHTGAGETPCSGIAHALLAKMDAQGVKIPIVCNSVGVGGSQLWTLLDNAATFNFQNLLRVMKVIAKLIEKTGKIPIPLPPVLLHFDPDTSGHDGYNVRPAEYLRLMRRYRDMYNQACRHLFGWHPSAPDYPLFIQQATPEGTKRWSGGVKQFSFDHDGYAQAQLATLWLDEKIILCGPEYAEPDHTDDLHKTSAGMQMVGHRMGRYMGDFMVGAGRRPIHIQSIVRTSATVITCNVYMPDGDTLTVDTATVGAFTNRGIVAWREDTALEVSISAVALVAAGVSTYRIAQFTVTLSADPGSAQVVLDVGLFGDSATPSIGRNRTTGCRTNFRGSTAYSTHNAGNYYEWLCKGRYIVPAVGRTLYAHNMQGKWFS